MGRTLPRVGLGGDNVVILGKMILCDSARFIAQSRRHPMASRHGDNMLLTARQQPSNAPSERAADCLGHVGGVMETALPLLADQGNAIHGGLAFARRGG